MITFGSENLLFLENWSNFAENLVLPMGVMGIMGVMGVMGSYQTY